MYLRMAWRRMMVAGVQKPEQEHFWGAEGEWNEIIFWVEPHKREWAGEGELGSREWRMALGRMHQLLWKINNQHIANWQNGTG